MRLRIPRPTAAGDRYPSVDVFSARGGARTNFSCLRKCIDSLPVPVLGRCARNSSWAGVPSARPSGLRLHRVMGTTAVVGRRSDRGRVAAESGISPAGCMRKGGSAFCSNSAQDDCYLPGIKNEDPAVWRARRRFRQAPATPLIRGDLKTAFPAVGGKRNLGYPRKG